MSTASGPHPHPHPLLSPGLGLRRGVRCSVIFRSGTICSRCRVDSVRLRSGRDSHAKSGADCRARRRLGHSSACQPAGCRSQRDSTGPPGTGFCWCGSGAGQPMQRTSSAWGASCAPSLVPGPKLGPASWEMRTVLPGRIPDLQLGIELGRGKRRKGRWPARRDPLWDLTLGGAEDADLSSEVQKGCHIPHWTPKASVCPTA